MIPNILYNNWRFTEKLNEKVSLFEELSSTKPLMEWQPSLEVKAANLSRGYILFNIILYNKLENT